MSAIISLIVLGAGFFFLRPHLGARSHATRAAQPAPAETERATVELDEFTVNLADSDRARYIKTSIALEVMDDKVAEQIEKGKNLPRVRDAVIMTLSRQYFRTLSTNDGKLALKRQLVKAVNAAIPQGEAPPDPAERGKVTDILFTSLVMQ